MDLKVLQTFTYILTSYIYYIYIKAVEANVFGYTNETQCTCKEHWYTKQQMTFSEIMTFPAVQELGVRNRSP